MPTGPLSSSRLAAESIGTTSLRSVFRISLGRNNLLGMLEHVLDAAVIVGVLFGLALYWEGDLLPPYMILSLLLFALTFPGSSRLRLSFMELFRDIVISWALVASLLWLFGTASKLIRHFDRDVLFYWAWMAPVAQMAAHTLLRAAAPWLLTIHGDAKVAIIAGMNEQGIALASQINADPYCGTRVLGFFDDRTQDRLAEGHDFRVLGGVPDLPAYVREHRVDVIYLSLPMATQPRILRLLDELRDTTASIYFVPDIFITDLIQGRMDAVGNMPVVAVCETPFTGMNGMVKRATDLVLSLLIMLLISPLLLVIAAGVKFTSPGPIIFKQRRYGLEGEEILVYKFRSMTVCEDGGEIKQAQKNDQRITRLGAFLRKSSLDELPQFINVLQGRMSIVGPRPHAVAHNEQYRKLIKGYMVRHKVKPGITGWAQVNGYRGETETVDKMQKRIEYDLEYLRNWSPGLDLWIIVKTALLVVKDDTAF